MWFRDGAEKIRGRANRRKKADGEQILQVDARAQEKKQARVRWVSAVTVLLVALFGCAWLAVMGADFIRVHLVATNPLFTLREADIRTDGMLKPQEIRERYNLWAGVNLFAISLAQIHADLLTIPGVRTVEIRRQLPGTLVMRVGERTAVALLVTDKMSLPVDREGYVLAPRAAMARLPVLLGAVVNNFAPGLHLTDPKIQDGLTALDLCEALRIGDQVHIDAISVANLENLELRLTSGERVLLGRAQIADRLRKLAGTKKALAARHQTADFIDCSMKRDVTVQLAQPAPGLAP